MNKNFDKKNENAKPSDNSIVTKKGFMLSFPKRKEQKSVANTNAPKNQEQKPQMQENNANREKNAQNERNGGKKFEKGHQNSHNKQNKGHHAQKPQNANNSKQGSPKEKANNSHVDVKKESANAPKNFRNDRRDRKNFKHNGKKPQKNHENNIPLERREEKAKQKTVGKIDADILASIKPSSLKKEEKETFRDYSKTDLPEKIDFEKYKNALPLAQQIALEEEKRKPKKAEQESLEGKMEIVGVRFREAGKIYYFAPNGIKAPFGTAVIVETARGLEYGIVAIGNRFVSEADIVSPLKAVIRTATQHDKEIYDQNKEQEAEAAKIFCEKTKKLNLEMKLVGVEYTFDCSRLLFYFTADGRVDFRELVKELAFAFKTRIELRQVGVRDAAKIFGGLGVCGRPLCCSTFLGDFMQVSIKMAKDQNLSLNSSKISGACGKLLCCLRYENEVYQIEYEKTPKNGAIVETPEGRGVVTESIPLKASVKVLLDSKKDSPPVIFHRDDVSVKGYLKNDDKADEDLKGLEE